MYENSQLRPLLSKQEEIKLCKIIKKGKPERKVEEAKNKNKMYDHLQN